MRRTLAFGIAGLLAAAVLLSACSDVALRHRDTAEQARYQAYAGPPIDQFTWVASHRGRAAIGKDQILAWADINRPYLITVTQPCPNLLLANHINITSTRDTVITGMSYVRARGFNCQVKTIQAVDYRRMQSDLRRERAASASH